LNPEPSISILHLQKILKELKELINKVIAIARTKTKAEDPSIKLKAYDLNGNNIVVRISATYRAEFENESIK